MSSAFIYKPTDTRDPKLGIKSSMPGLKEGIAWLILFQICSSERFIDGRIVRPTVEYKDENDKTQSRLNDEIKREILDLFSRNNVRQQEVIAALVAGFDTCTLNKTQMEPLIVAFEVFLQLAECEFDSYKKHSKSAERTGGERFGKSFKLTSGTRRLASYYEIAPKAFLLLMAEWIAGRQFEIDSDERSQLEILEKLLREQIFDLSSRAIFRVEDADENRPDHFFNTIGLYISLLRGAVVELPGNREPKGPLRILKNAIDAQLLPGLRFSHGEFKLDSHLDHAYLKNLVEERKNFEILSSIDFSGGNSSGSSKSTDASQEVSPMKNVILYGVPGSGKSYKINDEHVQDGDQVERVVFHPEYMYANFIGQILPVVSEGEVSYDFVPGPFTEVLKKAILNPDQRHVLIVEEINRGNAAAIFGDVFQLLDRDHSGASRYGIHNRDISKEIYGNVGTEIKIPSNLVLLATMNTSDQNVFTLDTAFQRRWSMEIVPNDLSKVPWANITIAGTPVTWRAFVTEINRMITTGLDSLASSEDKRLGAFFATEQELSSAGTRVFAEKVLKYLWDDAFKFNRSRVFREAESRTLEDVIREFVEAEPDKRWDAVFTSKLVTQLLPVRNPNEESGDEDPQVDSQN